MNKLTKGPALEECLRHYFISLGYYVIRGVKFKYNKFDVTDVDLWLYSRPSALSRQRTNVDIKNKRTPQAIERIFWTKGLQDVLGLDNCIVATTDSRSDVLEFGLQHHVSVLDGKFLTRLTASPIITGKRISEEDLFSLEMNHSADCSVRELRTRYDNAKSRVLSDLSFDSCNSYLNDIQFYITQSLIGHEESKLLYRLFYSVIGMFLINVDFILKDYASLDSNGRCSLLSNGFRYGTSGKNFADKLALLGGELTESYGLVPGSGKAIFDELNNQAQAIPVEVLSGFFSKSSVQNSLFSSAIEFESAAYSSSFVRPSSLSNSAQSILGTMCDFFSFDRKILFNF